MPSFSIVITIYALIGLAILLDEMSVRRSIDPFPGTSSDLNKNFLSTYDSQKLVLLQKENSLAIFDRQTNKVLATIKLDIY